MTWQGIRELIRTALGIYPTLDLHGFRVKEALAETEMFLRDARAAGITAVRIVYGKGHGSPQGRGVLRHVVPKWLDEDEAGRELVERYERRPDQSGADGYVVVWLKNREPGNASGQPGC